MKYFDSQGKWLAVAARCMPRLFFSEHPPICVVRPVQDTSAFQGWRMERAGEMDSVLGVLQPRTTEFVVDFGEHRVGRVRLDIGIGERPADAPLRLQLVFGEMPVEMGEKPGSPASEGLSGAWVQDETVTIDELPCVYEAPRRYAFRYLKIRIVDSSPWYEVKFNDIICTACSSAKWDAVSPVSEALPDKWQALDRVSLKTLADCMQTVFEDGPKRDRRLWVGDLRLQALANYETFKANDLVKRCLYLFAGLADDEGRIFSDAYERPVPRRGNSYLLDYGALYTVILHDYWKATGDNKTARDLWPAARRQLDLITHFVSGDGLLQWPVKVNVFIDWCAPLHRHAAMHALLMYAIQRGIALGGAMKDKAMVAALTDLLMKMRSAAQTEFWDSSRRLWVSGKERQVSWANWAWMTLAEVLDREEARQSYAALTVCPDAIHPNGPYLFHHVVDALFYCGLEQEARQLLQDYWGGMIARGATTFWEVYNPKDDRLAPYGGPLLNSYCHAWSCTPSFFIRKYLMRTATNAS